MRSRSSQRGAALLFTLVVLISLTVLVTAFVLLVSTRILGSGGSWTAAQAVWVAEGGLQQVYYRLYTDTSFRNSPTSPLTGTLGEGTYSVTVIKSGNSYTLASTGTVSSFSRKIQRSVTAYGGYPYAFDYAIFGNTNGSELEIRNNVIISGDLYYDGDVEVKVDAAVNDGLVYADAVTGAGTYTAASGAPSPVPAYPSFSTASYDDAISTADSTATSNWTLSGSSTAALSGTVYYKAVTIEDSASITGTGTIVATKDVIIRNSANIGPNITIITKQDLTVRHDAIVQSGGVLYGRNSVMLRDDAQVTGSVLVPASGKTATVQNRASLTGILYADTARLIDQSVVTGSVVADGYTNNRIIEDAQITFSASARPSALPAGFTATAVTVTPQNNWDEVAP